MNVLLIWCLSWIWWRSVNVTNGFVCAACAGPAPFVKQLVLTVNEMAFSVLPSKQTNERTNTNRLTNELHGAESFL